jgi:hypothetical protein
MPQRQGLRRPSPLESPEVTAWIEALTRAHDAPASGTTTAEHQRRAVVEGVDGRLWQYGGRSRDVFPCGRCGKPIGFGEQVQLDRSREGRTSHVVCPSGSTSTRSRSAPGPLSSRARTVSRMRATVRDAELARIRQRVRDAASDLA